MAAPPGRVLRCDDYVESSPRIEQCLAALQSLGGIQERTTSDPERPLGFLAVNTVRPAESNPLTWLASGDRRS